MVVKGTAEDWATESPLAAREAYQDPATGKRIKSGTKLGDDYQAKHLPVVRTRLCQAALGLAMVLNECFPEKLLARGHHFSQRGLSTGGEAGDPRARQCSGMFGLLSRIQTRPVIVSVSMIDG